MSPATTHLLSCCIFAICACSAADCAWACCSCEVCCSYAFSDTQADKISAANGMAAVTAVSFVVMVELLVAVAAQQSLDAGADCACELNQRAVHFRQKRRTGFNLQQADGRKLISAPRPRDGTAAHH